VETVISASLSLALSNKAGKTLGLTVRGTEVAVGWRFSTIRYSVNRIVLHFEAVGCSFPEEDWTYDVMNLAELEINKEFSKSVESTSGSNSDWSGSISVSSYAGSTKSSRSRATKKGNSANSQFSAKHRPILAHGTVANPSWSLTSEQSDKPLLGTLIKEDRFCRAEIDGPKPKVSVSFEIPYDAFLIRKPDSSFSNKFGIARLLLRAALCENRQKICEMELS